MSTEALTAQLPAIEAQLQPEQPELGRTARLGNTLRNGYKAVNDRIESIKDKAMTLAAIGGIAFVGAQAAELTANAEPVVAEGSMPAATTSNLEQECLQVALAKPDINKAQVLHAGNFNPKHLPNQYFYLSTKNYEPMPEACDGNYSRGNLAKAQAFRHGRWVNMGYFGNVSINPDSNQGNWQESGLEKNLHFPVCRARILLKTNMVDLNSDTGSPWHPHNTVATRVYTVPVTQILPHKSKGC